MSRTIELAEGIMAHVSDDVSPATLQALVHLAQQLRHREKFGYLSAEPMAIEDGVDYENRDVECAHCGALMPNSPWPTNSNAFAHRPRCGKCGSMMTYPVAVQEPAPNELPHA